jgi:hypothetical protein
MMEMSIKYDTKEKCREVLIGILPTFYREGDLSKFEWFPDQETEETYSLIYIDRYGYRRELSLNKRSGCVTLK